MRTFVAALTIAGTVLAGAAEAARAQAPGVDLKITPKVGGFAPLSDLQEAGESEDISLEPSVAFGLAVDIGLPAMVDLRAGFDYATSSELDFDDAPSPGNFDGDVKVLAVAGDIVLRRSVLGVVSPYLLLGAGVKRYDFNFDDAELGSGLFDTESENTDFTGHIGVGVRAGIGPLALVVEVSDYISSFSAGESDDSSLQNDIFGMVGIQLGIL